MLSIGEYSLRTWGKTQAAHYIGELQICCQTLADNPALGRLCDDVRPGLHRLEHAKHVVFYRQERGGILVSRILHQACCPIDMPSMIKTKNHNLPVATQEFHNHKRKRRIAGSAEDSPRIP
ncbi:MAG: hypothetical protein AUF67_07465 [Acidobacteria bacterium 13_1_20CM_58_21]|nr:MAG: hypothetical protein AUF67_07465 [Acidobacteria bacterium 13_1_20CM_58_21]